MKIGRCLHIAMAATVVLGLAVFAQASGSGSLDNDMLQELKRMIEQQQAQIDKQAAEIAALKEQLTGNSEAIAAKADKQDPSDTDKMVTSSFSNVNVSLYGQFNPALLYANNGDSSKWYVGDNTHSQSRLGLRASVDTTGGWTVGGRFEYGIVSNALDEVNNIETHNATRDNFKLRWAEVSFANDAFGKISLGKGDSSTNNTAEVDLSGTAVAMQDKTLWMAASTLWYDGSTGVLSDIKVMDIYTGYDGLSRTDRIRYDTPDFTGFSAAGSASSGDAFDGSIWYNREFSGTKIAAGAGLANPGDIMPDTDTLFTGSASILFPMGFNITLAGGYKDLEEAARDNGSFWWGKLGYKTRFYDAATTSFSFDYGESQNIRVNDEKGRTWALAVVHDVSDWGTEFYGIYRMYQAELDSADFDDVNSFMAGARLKF